MLKLCSKLLLATLPFLNVAHAEELKNPDGFNTPNDHNISRSSSEEYGIYTKNDRYRCLPKKDNWPPLDKVINEKGYLQLEGKIETASYGRVDGQNIAGFLMQSNYERVIKEMGGRLFAVMNGEDIGRGYMLRVHLIEKDG